MARDVVVPRERGEIQTVANYCIFVETSLGSGKAKPALLFRHHTRTGGGTRHRGGINDVNCARDNYIRTVLLTYTDLCARDD